VEILEKKVTQLEGLPDRLVSVEGRLGLVEGRLVLVSVESQIVQLRTEMADGFSALRSEMRKDSLKLAELIDERFVQQKRELLQEIRSLNEETNAQSRALYEDLKDSIKRLGEGGFGAKQ